MKPPPEKEALRQVAALLGKTVHERPAKPTLPGKEAGDELAADFTGFARIFLDSL